MGDDLIVALAAALRDRLDDRCAIARLGTVSASLGVAGSLELVKELGVDFVQGFHVGRPAPLQRWVGERNKARPRRALPAPAR